MDDQNQENQQQRQQQQRPSSFDHTVNTIQNARRTTRQIKWAFRIARTVLTSAWGWIGGSLLVLFILVMVFAIIMGGSGLSTGNNANQTASESARLSGTPAPTGGGTGIIIGQPNNSLASEAKSVMDSLMAACGNHVSDNDASCLYSAAIPSDIRAGFFGSLVFRGVLECLGFVQTIFLSLTGQGLIAPGNITKNIPPNNIPSGFGFITSPSYGNPGAIMEEGDIPIWDYDTYGHIGITVQTNGTDFVFAEANNCSYPCGAIDYAPDDIHDPHLKGWIRKL